MTTAESVRDLAIVLARSELEREEAVQELESACGGRRVAAVRARQLIASSLEADVDRPERQEAITLLDDLLTRLPG
jgi:hypothetical protein